MKVLLISIFNFLIINILYSQIVDNANFALCTHPMKVNRIELGLKQTIIEISIENQRKDGNFCADKNIDLLDAISKVKYNLIKSEGIPVCPDFYQFTSIGEILAFKLYFPKIDSKTKYLNIIENCDQYCFSIKGIILNSDMNKDINLGYDYYAKGKLDFALEAFKMAVSNNPDYPFGYLYFNIIQILAEKQDFPSAKTWYNKLKNSSFEDKNDVISRLKNQSFYFKII